jgi:hypothetical protein
MPVSLEREKIMQSICSLAALVLAVANPGGCANEAVLSKAEATDAKVVVAWNGPGKAQSAFKYYMPRPVSPPRIPRPKWP